MKSSSLVIAPSKVKKLSRGDLLDLVDETSTKSINQSVINKLSVTAVFCLRAKGACIVCM